MTPAELQTRHSRRQKALHRSDDSQQLAARCNTTLVSIYYNVGTESRYKKGLTSYEAFPLKLPTFTVPSQVNIPVVSFLPTNFSTIVS